MESLRDQAVRRVACGAWHTAAIASPLPDGADSLHGLSFIERIAIQHKWAAMYELTEEVTNFSLPQFYTEWRSEYIGRVCNLQRDASSSAKICDLDRVINCTKLSCFQVQVLEIWLWASSAEYQLSCSVLCEVFHRELNMSGVDVVLSYQVILKSCTKLTDSSHVCLQLWTFAPRLDLPQFWFGVSIVKFDTETSSASHCLWVPYCLFILPLSEPRQYKALNLEVATLWWITCSDTFLW